MTALLATSRDVAPGEQLAEEFVELLLAIGGEMGPYRRRAVRRGRDRRQARGTERRAGSDMRFLR
ncbi:hypothetical protein [Fimbriiglobus ruber]|uniref:Uncharacterized protein n=1 Tax=Fimbriiglobus ruber TaxID=1908690 RepID=A0A225DEK1_9BACT|nr:hypothetical protein [Fimbriiglobus ruber]OWK39970.1 hypothetical protein FRUB_05860 [Fimbriiglobus ruber]